MRFAVSAEGLQEVIAPKRVSLLLWGHNADLCITDMVAAGMQFEFAKNKCTDSKTNLQAYSRSSD